MNDLESILVPFLYGFYSYFVIIFCAALLLLFGGKTWLTIPGFIWLLMTYLVYAGIKYIFSIEISPFDVFMKWISLPGDVGSSTIPYRIGSFLGLGSVSIWVGNRRNNPIRALFSIYSWIRLGKVTIIFFLLDMAIGYWNHGLTIFEESYWLKSLGLSMSPTCVYIMASGSKDE